MKTAVLGTASICVFLSITAQPVHAQFVFAANPGNATVTLVEWQGSALTGALAIPSSGTTYVNGNYVTLPVTAIGVQALEGQRFITSVSIPNTVTSISYGAFGLDYALSSVSIPNSVISIGEEAFQNCALGTIKIPSSVNSIGGDAFVGCSGLTSAIFQGDAPAYSDDPNTVFAGDPVTIYRYAGSMDWGTSFDGDPVVVLAPEPSVLALAGIGLSVFGFRKNEVDRVCYAFKIGACIWTEFRQKGRT